MKSLDHFFSKQYDERRYNCLHFLHDVWFEITGEDLTPTLATVFVPGERTGFKATLKKVARLQVPSTPCIVYMHRPRMAPHVGVYIEGRVFHIQRSGVEYLPLDVAARGFTSVRFYR